MNFFGETEIYPQYLICYVNSIDINDLISFLFAGKKTGYKILEKFKELITDKKWFIFYLWMPLTSVPAIA